MYLRVLVVGDSVEEQMKPYDGKREGPFPVRLQGDQLDDLPRLHGIEPGDRQGLLASVRSQLGTSTEAEFDGDEVVCQLTYNLHAKWHTYEIGGDPFRLKAKNGEFVSATQARRSEIALPIIPVPHAVVKDGLWHESSLWTFANSCLIPYPPEEWDTRFEQLLAETERDDVLTLVSCYRSEDGPVFPRDHDDLQQRIAEDRRIVKAMGMFSQSAGRGKANPSFVPQRLYYGKVMRIPLREYQHPEHSFNRRDLFGNVSSLLQPKVHWTPAPRGPIERYEVIDIDTEDVLVMWRIPYCPRDQGTDDPKDRSAATPFFLGELASWWMVPADNAPASPAPSSADSRLGLLCRPN